MKNRVLIVSDGNGKWYLRQVAGVTHDFERDETIYRCDRPLGGTFDTIDEAVAALKAEIWLPGRPWFVAWIDAIVAPGESTVSRQCDVLFRAEEIEINCEFGRNPVIAIELSAVRNDKTVASTAPVSGRPVGIAYKDRVAKCNVMFQRADDVVLRVHNSSKETVRCNVKISGRAVL